MMKLSLARLPAGVSATVAQLSSDKAFAHRLRDFGLVPGTTVTVCYRSPYGGVTAVECRGTMIALRTKDIQGIQVRIE